MTNEQEKAKELAELLNAFAEGKQLEYYIECESVWCDYSKPQLPWILDHIKMDGQIRIKPEIKRVVRLTKKDLFERLRKRQTLKIEIDDVIINYSNITDQINALIGTPKNYTLKWLCEIRAKFADGTPCYKEVECE